MESDAGISEKNGTDFDGRRGRTTIASVFNLQEDFRAFSSRLIVERWRAEHQLQFPMSMALVHMMYRSELARSGRREVAGRVETVTKANQRKHKTRTAKTLGVELFSV